MAGLGPAIHEENPWIPGSSPGMTSFLAWTHLIGLGRRGASAGCRPARH